MPETLYIKLDAVDVRPLEDALLAIFNNETTDDRRYFELVSLRVSPSAPLSNSAASVGRAGMMSIARITALSGGDSMTPIQMDTADAALPAQVLVRNNPDTATATDIFRRIADAPAYSLTVGNSQFSSRTYGGSMMSHQKSHYADIFRGGESADVEPIILREGEGVGLFQDQYGTQHSMQTAAVVTDTATGATYICRSVDLSTDRRLGEATFAIFNGSGSGVVLAVRLWVLPMDGEAVLTPGLRLCRIAGLALGGDTVTPTLPDTSKSVPSALQVVSGSFQPVIAGEWQADYYSTHGLAFGSGTALQAWNKAQIDAGTFSRSTRAQDFRAIGETSGMRAGTMDDDLMFSAKAGEGIIIKPGTGLGLVAGRDVASGGTQAINSNSTGVQYGAGGTEFTGTYAAGGGGNTYSKSRVVNKG